MTNKPLANKILWTGLTFILALNAVLAVFKFQTSVIIPLIGAFIMVVGLIFLWLDR